MANLPVNIIGNGASADIYTLGNGRVLKAFLRKSYTEAAVVDWADHDAMTKAEFRFEALSYERLQFFHKLEIFAPKFFGRADPIKLLSDDPGAESRYVEGCGLLLEYIPGAALKLARLDLLIKLRVEELLERFRDVLGIRDVWDGSCFIPGNRAEFTVIDFATWNGFYDYQVELNETGRLSPVLRARLEGECAD